MSATPATISPTKRRAEVAARLHGQLESLVQRASGRRPDPAASRTLAALRQGAGVRFGTKSLADSTLVTLLGPAIGMTDGSVPVWSESLGRLLDDAMLVGSLVAANRVRVRRVEAPGPSSFGRDLHALRPARENAAEQLMHALLGTERQGLDHHLRRAISILSADDKPIDAAALVRDLGHWGAEDRRVQRRWAYHFWSNTRPSDDDTQDNPTAEANA